MLKQTILNKVQKYPHEFYTFKNGVNIEDAKIKQMLSDVAEDLHKSPTSNFCYMATGNTIVIGFKMGPENGKYEYQFVVSKNYSEISVYGNDSIEYEVENDPKKFFHI